jgi:hypothetical protein
MRRVNSGLGGNQRAGRGSQWWPFCGDLGAWLVSGPTRVAQVDCIEEGVGMGCRPTTLPTWRARRRLEVAGSGQRVGTSGLKRRYAR